MSFVYQAPELCIGGRWCAGEHALSVPIVNPAHANTLDQLKLASPAQIEQALIAAQQGFEAWRQVPAFERCARLEKGVARMRQNIDAIAQLLTLEQGAAPMAVMSRLVCRKAPCRCTNSRLARWRRFHHGIFRWCCRHARSAVLWPPVARSSSKGRKKPRPAWLPWWRVLSMICPPALCNCCMACRPSCRRN